MKRHRIFQCFWSADKPQPQAQQLKGSNGCLLFSGNYNNLIKNGEILLEERVSLFDGRTNPIRCFSVDDLNSMNVNNDSTFQDCGDSSYAGVWDSKCVLVKTFCKSIERVCREIAVATQMGNHGNVHRLLGFCLDTKYPVLVYEWPRNGTLHDRVLNYKEQSKEPLEWKDRLRIAWEIAHAVAYLHTAFKRPIIHRDLNPTNVYLDQDDSARLSDFNLSISIPEGETHVEDNVVIGTQGYLAPDYMISGKVAASSDVFAFGVLLLVILTGKPALFTSESFDGWSSVVYWVNKCRKSNCLSDIVDQAITINGPVADEHFEHHLKELVDMALMCSSQDKELRPTMVDVATQLKNMIMLSSDSLSLYHSG